MALERFRQIKRQQKTGEPKILIRKETAPLRAELERILNKVSPWRDRMIEKPMGERSANGFNVILIDKDKSLIATIFVGIDSKATETQLYIVDQQITLGGNLWEQETYHIDFSGIQYTRNNLPQRHLSTAKSDREPLRHLKHLLRDVKQSVAEGNFERYVH